MKDLIGQEVRRGDTVAHIVFGGRYNSGYLSLAKVIDFEGEQNVRIYKQLASRTSVVGHDKILVVRKQIKLSELVVQNDGRLNNARYHLLKRERENA